VANQDDSRITVKVGRSTHKKSREAAREALDPLTGTAGPYRLVFVYSSIKHKHGEVLAEVRQRLGDVPVLGCTTTGELSSDGFTSDGLVIAGLASGCTEAAVGHGDRVFERPEAAAREAVDRAQRAMETLGGPARQRYLCILHTAGFTLDHAGVEEDILAAVQDELGDDWIVLGGSASDGARFLGSKEFIGDRVLDGSVVLGLIATDLEVHHDMAHGFSPTDRSFPITEAQDYLVKRIDGRLAVDFYADLIGVKPKQLTKGLGLLRMTDKVPKFLTAMTQKVGLTPQVITDRIPFFAYAVDHPFGARSDSGAFVLKVPKTISPEGWLEFQTRMDDVEELQLMQTSSEAMLSASADAIASVSRAAADHPPRLVLVYECLGRYMYLLKQIDRVFPKIRAATDAEIVGFFSAAEQGTMAGVECQSHNYTTSVLGLG
jgi:hypothetical protein